jgi:Tfp pilus assembly pilus retraction ATPase PilT
LNELLEKTIKEGASDLHLTVGVPPVIRVNGELIHITSDALIPLDTEKYVKDILNEKEYEEYKSKLKPIIKKLVKKIDNLETLKESPVMPTML